jgi:flagellar basal body rod protein FlgB
MNFASGGLTLSGRQRQENIMFHDRNNRDLERLMQSVAENTMVHNAAVEMVRNQFQMLGVAISERI